MRRRKSSLRAAPLLTALLVAPSSAYAVRPFITDDARVVGARSLQLETWIRADAESFQHWVLVGFGPVGPLELTVGGVHGAVYGGHAERGYAAAGPLLQAKVLFREPTPNAWPGVAMSAGIQPPLHHGGFGAVGWDGFGYVAVTESLGHEDRVLLHVNLGFYATTAAVQAPWVFTWGVGAQVRVWGPINAVAEVFSGDPYAGGSGAATQVGTRIVLNNNVQLDATAGVGLWGDPTLPFWGTAGLRLASNRLW